ncbi:NAD(P)/FAD-dependent oxidoreductase [Mangrovitalea sediminis]|uniref:NAD(P)/FAD-dependent oxidoreductase n=1 Tax=Mangrovitalea sediminis TaxID=1982043 RepID=UPI000BE4D05D|nr:FAD-dependent oxidoreductase [Mangrovitalea sediminis]
MISRQRIAVVGTGISGLTAAWMLSRRHEVHIFEANDYAGGHTHTLPVERHGRVWPVNTGFIVFNDWTYPNFIRLMQVLGVESEPSDMSFSVQSERRGLEYNGTSLNTLFAQRRNLLNPRFINMIREILRFNRITRDELARDVIQADETLAAYLRRHRFSNYFRDHYIIPMGAAIWSAPEGATAQFPVRFFLRFFENHGMLSVDERPQWRVLKRGSASYVKRMLPHFGDKLHLNAPVEAVLRHPKEVEIRTPLGSHRFDQIVMACHSDQALALLKDATPAETEILGAIPYQMNDVVLHTDECMLPNNRRAWAAWNYYIPQSSSAPVSVTYNMNILQNFDAPETFCVTLNRSAGIHPLKIIKRFQYAHPEFTLAGVEAQSRYHDIGNRHRTHFCGAYWHNGFHEDGVRSALRVVNDFGIEYPILEVSRNSQEVPYGQAPQLA